MNVMRNYSPSSKRGQTPFRSLTPFAALCFFLLFGRTAMAFQIESPEFQSQEKIPGKYTCDGEDLSPPLGWSDPPEGTKSFALIADDPDASIGTWVHWVLYNMPPGMLASVEGIPKEEILPDGTRQGMSDFKKIGYGGPCPPPGPAHRYSFKVYALNAMLDLPPGATKADFLVAANGHILAQAELTGLYQKQ